MYLLHVTCDRVDLLIRDTLGQLHLCFVRRLSSLGGAKCLSITVKKCLGPHAMSFVERFIILCPYLGESTIRGSTALLRIDNDQEHRAWDLLHIL